AQARARIPRSWADRFRREECALSELDRHKGWDGEHDGSVMPCARRTRIQMLWRRFSAIAPRKCRCRSRIKKGGSARLAKDEIEVDRWCTRLRADHEYPGSLGRIRP